jgi:hypothetical protein
MTSVNPLFFGVWGPFLPSQRNGVKVILSAGAGKTEGQWEEYRPHFVPLRVPWRGAATGVSSPFRPPARVRPQQKHRHAPPSCGVRGGREKSPILLYTALAICSLPCSPSPLGPGPASTQFGCTTGFVSRKITFPT